MSDWIGLVFFLLIPIGIFIGLKLLSYDRKSTEQEFEQRASDSSSLIGVGFSALSGMLNPSEPKGKEAITEVKKGRFKKKQAKGKDIGDGSEEE